MGVEALTDAGHPLCAGQQFGHREVLRIGQFHQGRIAGGQHDPSTVGLDHGGVVGRLIGAGPVGIGLGQAPGAGRLRGLGAIQAVAGHGFRPTVQSPTQGVGDGQSGEGGVGVPERGEKLANVALVDQRSRGVVDKDRHVSLGGEGGQACLHRQRAGRAADGQLPAVQSGQDFGRCLLGVLGHDDHEVDRAGREKALDRPAQHRLAGQAAPLLGGSGAGPGTASGGDDDGGETHGRVIEAWPTKRKQGLDR